MVGRLDICSIFYCLFLALLLTWAQSSWSDAAFESGIPELDCVIEPSEIVDAGSATPGVLEAIYADRSDVLKKGTVIARLESRAEEATLERAKAQAEMTATIELRKQTFDLGQLTLDRNKKLLEVSAISAQDMDTLLTQNRISALEIEQERHNKHIAELEYRRAQATLQRRIIRSPIDGVVMDRFKAVGEYVEDEPVLRVARLDPLFVEVVVPVDYLGQIRAGMQAEVFPKALGQTSHVATVERVDRVADAASGTYGVRLSISNPDYAIAAGLRCKLAFLPADLQQETAAAYGDNHQSHWVRSTASTAEAHLDDLADNDKTSANLVRKLMDLIPFTKPQPLVKNSSEVEADSALACYSVGPLADEALTQKLANSVLDDFSIINKQLRSEAVSVEKGFFVLASFSDLTADLKKEATRELIQKLKQSKISDYMIVAQGTNKGRVSLGYFSRQASATVHQQDMAKQGVEAEIVRLQEAGQQFWLDFSGPEQPGLKTALQEVANKIIPDSSLKLRDCLPQMASR